MPPRLFTPAEALIILPAVRELMAAMQAKKQELDEMTGELDGLSERASSNGHSSTSRAVDLRAATERVGRELNDLIAEMDDLGCELKGIDDGLVDFQSMREGRIVYLCWKMGEADIRYWHELDTGFPGRRPL